VLKIIQTNKLLGILAEKGVTQKEMASAIGVTPKTFYSKMKKGIFGSNEIEIMIRKLDIKDPGNIFFNIE
jgi:DNA-binding XRE family transcriptional regulator